MSSSIGKKNIAYKGSNHGAASPPAASLVSPPAPPAPAAFPYTCRAATAANTAPKYRVNSYELMIEGSTMDIDPPANEPARPTSGDILTHATTNIAVMTMGSLIMHVCGKGVCGTGDIVAMNVMNAKMFTAQMMVPLLEGADFEAASKSNAAAAAMNEKYWRAYHPERAKQTKAGDPVDLGTGFVVDEAVDLELPGPVKFTWLRTYSSALHKGKTALGKGGWMHSFEQWIEVTESGVRLHDEEGLPVDFPPPPPNGTSFHRGRRLELRALQKGYEVRSLDDRLIRAFAPLPSGRIALQSIRDVYSHPIRLEYSGELLVRAWDSVGREIRVLNDAKGRVARVEVWAAEPGSREPATLQTWFDYAYHREGELASHTNALGNAKLWEYDGLHRLVKTTARNGISFYYQYSEETGRCARTWGDGGLHDVHIDIDPEKGETRTHGTNRARRYLWRRGVVRREETFEGDWAIANEYDDDELFAAWSNASGEAYALERDHRGNVIRETDPAGNATTWEYVDDLPARRTGPTGLETRYHRDHHGALSAVTLPSGVTYSLERDQHGRLAAIHGPEGAITALSYDGHSNRTCETSRRGAKTSYRYDALGRPTERIDPLGRVERVRYDELGQAVELLRPDGTTFLAAYDPVGNLASATDGLGRTTRLEYSGTGRVARLLQPDGQIYAFVYDADERLTEIINPRLERYQIEYDRADRVVSETTFDGRTLTYRYNRAGRVVRIDYPEGEWREFTHDKLGNILDDRGSDVQIAFKRDALGRIDEASCQDVMGKVVTVFERDRFGRVLREIQNGRSVRSEYDRGGRRTARVIEEGERTEYRYDEDDALVGITHAGATLSIERDAVGRERVRKGSGFRLETEYEARDGVSSQRVLTSAGDLGGEKIAVQRRYGYDAGGRVTTIEGSRGLAAYRYDHVDQLVEATLGDLREVFEYDPVGSLVSAVRELDGPAKRALWAFGPGNRLKATDRAKYVNDARGRRIQRIQRIQRMDGDGSDPRESPPRGDEGVTTYGWDTKDRLREVVLPNGTRVRFLYDAFGRRVRKDVRTTEPPLLTLLGGSSRAPSAASTVEFLWDGDVLCEERQSLKGGGAPRRVHVHEPEGFVPLLQAEDGKVFSVIVDHLGTPKELLDERGQVAFRAQHGAWGDIVSVERDPGAPLVESPFRLLGQYADEETGLCYARFRYFEASSGRWLSPDPLEIKGGPNLFGLNGAPTMIVDPLGLAKPWAPHNPTQNDIVSKGIHFNTDIVGLELSVRSDDGNTIRFQKWPKPDTPMTGPETQQAEIASQKLNTDAKWRKRLLDFANEGIKQLRDVHKMEDLAKAMERVRDALSKVGAKKGGQA